LRARDKEGSHAQANDQALGSPDGAKAGDGLDVGGVYGRENEQAQWHKNRAKADNMSEVASVEETADWVRQEENQEAL
jgi:hypothetical protein